MNYIANCEGEWIAAVALLLLLVFSHQSGREANHRTRMFHLALMAAEISIIVNLWSIALYTAPDTLSSTYVYGVNLLYFLVIGLCVCLIACYTLAEMFVLVP